jgi:hypothetical protein
MRKPVACGTGLKASSKSPRPCSSFQSLSMHMLSLDDETHLALFEFPLLTLNFIVKASGEDLAKTRTPGSSRG